MASLSPQAKGVLDLIAFRKQMGELAIEDIVTEYWSRDVLDELSHYNTLKNYFKKSREVSKRDEKVAYVQRALRFNRVFEVLGIVKYIGISGSIASDMFKEGEDIDLFIVTADGTSWLYRGLLKLLLGKKARLYEDVDITDTLCINFIAEERGLLFDPDIFVLHELIHLVDVYNPDYRNRFLELNPWLVDNFGMQAPVKYQTGSGLFSSLLKFPLKILDYFSYQLQLFYMKLRKHKPEVSRIKEGRSKGRIEFYPTQFRVKVMREYWIERENLNRVVSIK
jgi:predicted nucleotidyltransferase